MLESIEEVGIENGIEKTAKNLIQSELLTIEQIAEVTGLAIRKIKELSESLNSTKNRRINQNITR